MEEIVTDGFLFEQLPKELNLIILHSIKSDDWFRLSRTCKRWKDNTKNITKLEFRITHKPTRLPVPNPKNKKSNQFRQAELNITGISAALNRFDPERLRSLDLSPDLEQHCPTLENFITKCTSLQLLDCIRADYIGKAIGTLTQLKHFCTFHAPSDGEKFSLLLQKLPNLASLELPHATWKKEINFQKFYSDLRNLKALKIHFGANLHMNFEFLGKMTQLTRLEMPHADITDEGFQHLSGLTNLEMLKLPALQVYFLPDEISIMENDEPVVGNPDPLNGLRHLTSLKKLTYLDVSDTPPSLRNPSLSELSALDLAELVQRHFKHLKTINVANAYLREDYELKLKNLHNISNDHKDLVVLESAHKV